MEGDEIRRKASDIRLGDILDDLSVEELAHRITLLEVEIIRVRSAMAARQGTRAVAEELFRK